MPGFSCDVEVVLAPAEQSGLTEPVRAGNRSLLYVFGGGDPGDAHSVTYGAAVTDVASGGAAGETLAGRLWFWGPGAESYAHRGAEFEAWYGGRVVGHGRVL